MKNRMVHFVLISLLCTFSLSAQSFFSTQKNGIGLKQYYSTVRGLGMGNTGIASIDSLTLGNYGVSQWLSSPDTRASIAMDYQRVSLEAEGQSQLWSTSSFTGLSFAIPFKKSGWMIGASLNPYSHVDYKTTQTVESGGISFPQLNIIDGTISQAKVNLMWAPTDQLGLSVSGNFFFGTIEDRYQFPFSADTDFADLIEYISGVYSVEYSLFGGGIGFSGHYDLIPNRLKIAGFADLAPTIDVQITYPDALIEPEEREAQLTSFPIQYGAGVAFGLTNRVNIAADYAFQESSQTLDIADPTYNDWYHMGIGIERSSLRKRNVSFLNQLDLRGGFSVNQLGYRFNNESVMEYTGSFGFGFPFGASRNRFDVAIFGGVRGDDSKNLASERFINLQISLSMGETWFLRGRL
ncbi:MAG: hypothetical protein ACRBF0_18085 [Calditrichia bacterium]